jgi:hypothetical protein
MIILHILQYFLGIEKNNGSLRKGKIENFADILSLLLPKQTNLSTYEAKNVQNPGLSFSGKRFPFLCRFNKNFNVKLFFLECKNRACVHDRFYQVNSLKKILCLNLLKPCSITLRQKT